ncbi:MAG: UDP-2,3-diacylglucosamine hydrolase [Epsilonproteobacteria bacterium]|nr:UDP-2,3-diacylglucosamine hydrolase [Campylobacterota bacterium]
MSPDLRLREGAWLIADAHYAPARPQLYHTLLLARNKGLLPDQIILFGDIFDLLFGDAPVSIEPNRKMVDLLIEIAREREVIYLEGNHDFGLAPLFGDVMRVVPRTAQPLIAEWAGKRWGLHHGDLLEGKGYELYTALIRSRGVVRGLNILDRLTGGSVMKRLNRYNLGKQPCRKIVRFYEKQKQKMDILMRKYEIDGWIEGHSHQDIQWEYGNIMYVNLPAFMCGGGIGRLGGREETVVERITMREEKGSHGVEK